MHVRLGWTECKYWCVPLYTHHPEMRKTCILIIHTGLICDLWILWMFILIAVWRGWFSTQLCLNCWLRLAAKVGNLANLGWKTAAGKNILILETAYFLNGFWKQEKLVEEKKKNILISETASSPSAYFLNGIWKQYKLGAYISPIKMPKQKLLRILFEFDCNIARLAKSTFPNMSHP